MLFFVITLIALFAVVYFEITTSEPKANIMLAECERGQDDFESLDLVESAGRYHPYEGFSKS